MIKKYRTKKGKGRPLRLVCEEEYDYSDLVKDPREVFNLMKKIRALKDTEERMYLIRISKSGQVKGLFEVAHGSISSTILNERGIAQRALLSDAADIIIVHNHPDGKTEPSSRDYICSRRIENLADMIGICLIDSIIVGKGYFSFRENGLLRPVNG